MYHKKANGSGSIRQRSDGRWEGRYSAGFDPGTGKQIQRSIYGKTQKEVRQKLNKIIVDIDSGTYVKPQKLSVSAWLRIWLNEYTGNVKPFTKKAYEDRVRLYIIPSLGAVKLADLTPPMVQKFINGLGRDQKGRKALAPKTIKNVHGVLHRALLQALMVGYINSNPADHCTLPRIVRSDIKPLDEEKIAEFLEAVSGTKYEAIFLIDLFTGLRQGEILGLTWNCVDFNNNLIIVKHQLQREKIAGGKYYLTTLKNNKIRILRVAPTVMELLHKRKTEQELQRLAAHDLWQENIPNLVFENPMGGNLTHTTIRKHFKKIVAQIGMPETRFHDLRHSFAVVSIQNGDDVKTVQENLGHHSAAFTLDVYGHVTDRMKNESARRMEEYINKII